ncbi:MAG: hypothetical protein Q4C55_06060 [Eubacterium sp.]|nr:hypothetical protein [Eubacterium sp.]
MKAKVLHCKYSEGMKTVQHFLFWKGAEAYEESHIFIGGDPCDQPVPDSLQKTGRDPGYKLDSGRK